MQLLAEQVLVSLPDGLFLILPDHTLSLMNPHAERIMGISQAQAIGNPFSHCLPNLENLHERLATTLSTGHGFTIRKAQFINKLGENFSVELRILPLHDSEGKITAATLLMRDLSDSKKMEEERLYSDRLSVMGTIASGLAHEIKNPLGGIKGAAQMLSREVRRSDLKEYLEIIIKEAERVNQLISELLNFSKPKKVRLGSVNINRLLDEALQLEEKAKKEKTIQFIRNYDPSLPKVKGDENSLKQVFLNLIRNAHESISKKGSVTLGTRMVTDYQLKTLKGRAARLIEIDITDTGCGMNEETLARLFSPFFTTKPWGTGLGLSICHRIIDEHQGFMQIESAQKKGTSFKIYLRTS